MIGVENVDVRSDGAINSKKVVNIIVVVTENKWRYNCFFLTYLVFLKKKIIKII